MKPKAALNDVETNSLLAGSLIDKGKEDDAQWTTVISPRRPWFHISLAEIWCYRDLIFLFVRRDFVAQYKQTVLGPLWFFLQPLFTTIVFTVVFGRIARIPTDGMPTFLFYLSGTVCWGYFAACLVQTGDTFVTNAALFGKVYFPRLTVPIAIIISNILKFLIQFSLFFILLIITTRGTPIKLNAYALALPLLIFQMALLGLGCGIIVASLTTKYRDLNVVISFGMQLWMFGTPIVYPLSQVPKPFRMYLGANPMTSVVELFRLGFLGKTSITAEHIILGWIMTLIIISTGLFLFSRIERTFMDTV